MRMYWATPVPIKENAGINIQNHHAAPIDLERAMEIIRKATPINMLLKARSSVSSFRRRPRLEKGAHAASSSAVVGCKDWPASACGTRLMFAPHTRQKLAPSKFWVAHFGQNISSHL